MILGIMSVLQRIADVAGGVSMKNQLLLLAESRQTRAIDPKLKFLTSKSRLSEAIIVQGHCLALCARSPAKNGRFHIDSRTLISLRLRVAFGAYFSSIVRTMTSCPDVAHGPSTTSMWSKLVSSRGTNTAISFTGYLTRSRAGWESGLGC